MPAYLTESSNADTRSYAVAAAKDRQITYSISSNTDAIITNWINRIYEYLSKTINVTFSRVESGGEFTLSLEEPNYRDLYESDYIVNSRGLIRWSSVHNTRQYGGVEDQRNLTRAIGNSLGLSRLNWAWEAAGNTGTYTTADTIMSQTPWDRDYDFGHTIFFREDDKNALKQIFEGKHITPLGNTVKHIQREEEDLLLGKNGQIDLFYLVAKGMNSDNKDAISYDPVTGWDWVNDYNIPTIGNFNPYEGDRILIDRRLYAPTNPINPNTDLPETLDLKESKVKTSDYLNDVEIDFIFANTPESDKTATYTHKNTIFNDAGKLMLNVNGEQPGNGPGPVTGNGQLLAFVDIVGARPFEFQANWLSLWDRSAEQDVTRQVEESISDISSTPEELSTFTDTEAIPLSDQDDENSIHNSDPTTIRTLTPVATPEPTPEPVPTLIPKLQSIDETTTQNQATTFQLTKSVRLQNQQVEMLISGTDKKDKITGSSEGEILSGGKGKDVLKGGDGADGFLFQNPDFGKKEADKIKDFNDDEGDTIIIDKKIFEVGKKVSLKSVPGKKALKKAFASNKEFVYDEKKGFLYFNQNGKERGWGDGGLFVKLQGAPELTQSDFTIV